MRTWMFVLASVGVTACGGGGGGGEETTLFPATYASTYTRMRTCMPSPDHDLDNVLVYTDPLASEPYMNRDNPFPVGAVVLKEEYGVADMTCSGPITQWTVMVKLPDGSSPMTLDWHWQRVQADRTVETDNDPACYNCHVGCGVAPDGFDDTCSPQPD